MAIQGIINGCTRRRGELNAMDGTPRHRAPRGKVTARTVRIRQNANLCRRVDRGHRGVARRRKKLSEGYSSSLQRRERQPDAHEDAEYDAELCHGYRLIK